MLSAIEAASDKNVLECTMVMPGVYITGLTTSNNIAELQRLQIASIVRCRGFRTKKLSTEENDLYQNRPANVRKFIKDNRIAELVVTLSDSPKADIGCYFREAIDAIHAARKRGRPILVHCDMGISRSVTLIAAYKIWLAAHSKRYITDVSQVIAKIREKRKIANPNPGFVNILQCYRGMWYKERRKQAQIRKLLEDSRNQTPTLSNLMRHAGKMISANF